MGFPLDESAASRGRARLTLVETSCPSAGRELRAPSGLEPFAVEVERGTAGTIVQPRGELDVATVETLRTTLDAAIAATEHGARLVLDLRGLSFIDSCGLHLLVALNERAGREGFQLTLIAPAAPTDRAIRLCGLYEALPFAEHGSEALTDVP
jgi:anti-sigma B factor antagonist